MIFEKLKDEYFAIKKTGEDKFKTNFIASVITEIHALGKNLDREPTDDDCTSILDDMENDIKEEMVKAEKRGHKKEIIESTRELEIIAELREDVFKS